jgi:hypothetical protein
MKRGEELGDRIRALLVDRPDIVERAMFGGIAFFLGGHMACGPGKDCLHVRVGRDRWEESLGRPHAREMDLTGRSMRGWVTVDPGGYSSDEELTEWVQLGLDYAGSLPPK